MKRTAVILVLVAAAIGLVGCLPDPVSGPVVAQPGECWQRHNGWARTEVSTVMFPGTEIELAQIDLAGSWSTTGWGNNCTGQQVGDPALGARGCSGNRSWAFASSLRNDCWDGWFEDVTRQDLIGSMWMKETGEYGYSVVKPQFPGQDLQTDSGGFVARVRIRANNVTANMYTDCWVEASTLDNTIIDCSHEHVT